MSTPRPEVAGFFHAPTNTVTYVVSDPATGRCAVIDPVLDYDNASGRVDTKSADEVIAYVRANNLSCDWVLETHAHADHLSAAPRIKTELGGKTGIGTHIADVQAAFKDRFNARDLTPDGSQFDVLFDDGDGFAIGALQVRVMHTPGHTPACSTYVIGDAAFVGDTVFMPDFGTARCDFPGGSARDLYRSVRRVLSELPPETRVFVGHDYAPGGRAVAWETTVGEQRAHNKHVRDGVSEDEFVAMRTKRDAELGCPALIIESIQVNIRAGEFPPAEDDGRVYLKIPVNSF